MLSGYKSRALFDRVMLLKAPRVDIQIIGSGLKKSATDDLAPPPINVQIIYRAARDQQLHGCACPGIAPAIVAALKAGLGRLGTIPDHKWTFYLRRPERHTRSFRAERVYPACVA